jgi:hypothetical protein
VIALLQTRSLTLRLLALAVALALVGAPLAVTAQPPGKARRIGFVSMLYRL